eukprot:8819662-Alexandrium_andersonii.AAC.1
MPRRLAPQPQGLPSGDPRLLNLEEPVHVHLQLVREDEVPVPVHVGLHEDGDRLPPRVLPSTGPDPTAADLGNQLQSFLRTRGEVLAGHVLEEGGVEA